MKIICLFILLSSSFVYAQNNSSSQLEQQLAIEKAGTTKLKLLNELVNTAFYENLDKALAYTKQGVQLAKKTSNKNWQPKFDEMQGWMHSYLLQFDSAKICFGKATAGYIAVGDKHGQATTAFKLAWVLKRSGENEKAMEEDLSALRWMEQMNDKKGIATAYDRISDGLSRQGRKAEALDYAKKAIALCEENGFKNELAYAWFNMGNVYIAIDSQRQSLEYYDKAVKAAQALGLDPVSVTHAIVGRGNALKRLKRFPEALADYNTASSTAKRIHYVNAIAVTIANLGEVNMRMGNYKTALPYQLETVRLQEQNHILTNLTENYEHVSTIYEHLGDYKLALEYQKKARKMRDSVASAKSDVAMSGLLTQYQTEKKEAIIQAQQGEISQQKKVQWLSIGVAALLAGFLVVGYRSLRNRSRSNKLLAAKNAENELLLKEIHHRVKNNLEVVSSLLALQSAQINDPNTREAMQEGQNRVHSIGIVHQKLYQGENLGAIEMKDYFLNLGESILDSFGAEKRVSIELAMEKLNVDIDTAVPLGLIVNELLTNTLKYAFPNSRHGSVRIKLEKQTSGILHLEVSDNGIGKSGVTYGSGFGSQLVSLLTRQLNGSMKEEIQNGTRIFFDFKLDKVA